MTFRDKNPLLRYLDGERWRLESTVVWFNGINIEVPEGFETDFASVPRMLWSIIPPTGSHGLAAVLHDYLYATGVVSRAAADALFLRAMADLDVRWTRRYAMYLGVRTGGWIAWRRYRQAERASDDAMFV